MTEQVTDKMVEAAWIAFCTEGTGSVSSMRAALEAALDYYDAERDAWESVDEAYRAIRERQAAGGPGWVPR